jgi:hypothetical protein
VFIFSNWGSRLPWQPWRHRSQHKTQVPARRADATDEPNIVTTIPPIHSLRLRLIHIYYLLLCLRKTRPSSIVPAFDRSHSIIARYCCSSFSTLLIQDQQVLRRSVSEFVENNSWAYPSAMPASMPSVRETAASPSADKDKQSPATSVCYGNVIEYIQGMAQVFTKMALTVPKTSCTWRRTHSLRTTKLPSHGLLETAAAPSPRRGGAHKSPRAHPRPDRVSRSSSLLCTSPWTRR